MSISKTHAVFVVLLPVASCTGFASLLGLGSPSDAAHDREGPEGGAEDTAIDVGSAQDIGALPAFFSVDGGTASASASPADGGFGVALPWDAGLADAVDATLQIPSKNSLPSASPIGNTLALASDSRTMAVEGCGEPPSCFLRASIETQTGHLYQASRSSAYPDDTCARDWIGQDQSLLIGDSNPRFGDLRCDKNTPQISVGFLIPELVLQGWRDYGVWTSPNGFRSEWRVVNASGADSGAYEPLPGAPSLLLPLWIKDVFGGEIYGELLVPLRHTTTRSLAVGYLLFDVWRR